MHCPERMGRRHEGGRQGGSGATAGKRARTRAFLAPRRRQRRGAVLSRRRTAAAAGTTAGFAGFHEHPTRERRGSISLRISNRFTSRSLTMEVKPVILPPGRARFGDDTVANRIANGGHHDWDSGGRPLRRKSSWRAIRDDHGRPELYQLRDAVGVLLDRALRPAIFQTRFCPST